jgi:hypothetical protein
MGRPTDFRFLQRHELDGLSLDEKLAYVDVLCAEVLGDNSQVDEGTAGIANEPTTQPKT